MSKKNILKLALLFTLILCLQYFPTEPRKDSGWIPSQEKTITSKKLELNVDMFRDGESVKKASSEELLYEDQNEITSEGSLAFEDTMGGLDGSVGQELPVDQEIVGIEQTVDNVVPRVGYIYDENGEAVLATDENIYKVFVQKHFKEFNEYLKKNGKAPIVIPDIGEVIEVNGKKHKLTLDDIMEIFIAPEIAEYEKFRKKHPIMNK